MDTLCKIVVSSLTKETLATVFGVEVLLRGCVTPSEGFFTFGRCSCGPLRRFLTGTLGEKHPSKGCHHYLEYRLFFGT
jgi:hypothetical protein